MSYLQDRKRKNKKYFYIGIFLFGLFIFLYFSIAIFAGLSVFANGVFVPVVKLGNRIHENLRIFGVYLQSKESLSKENENLRATILANEARIANYEVLFNENEKLKEILARKHPGENLLLAGMISNPNKSPYDTLIIDAGRLDGIDLGDTVFAYGDVPIGKVSEVFDHSAKVVLFSTYGEKNSAVLSGSDTFVELIGRGRGNFEIILPRDFDIASGTLALLPGVTSYVLAEVVEIISDPRDSFKKALLKSPVNIFELKFVEVRI